MKIFLLLTAIAVIVGIFLWRRGRGRKERPARDNSVPSAPTGRSPIRFRAGANACNPAKQRAGELFQSNERPRLPLPGCQAQRCGCRFENVPDRRREQRRQQEERRETIRYEPDKGDRRKGDRRKSSADPWGIDRE